MLEYITKQSVQTFVQAALREDVGPGDYSSLACFPETERGKVKLLCKGDGVLAGAELAQAIIVEVDPTAVFFPNLTDGNSFRKGDVAFTIEASVLALLKAERLILNCMQRMSGIATLTNRLSKKIAHTSCRLLDTRKTTPNFRLAEKWAVHIGGGTNHRFGLYDMVMLKDNHIDFCGGIGAAVAKAQHYLKKNQLDLKIVVEVRTLEEVAEALEFPSIYRLLLDNMATEEIRSCLQLIGGRVLTEASGGITEENLVAYAETGVDFISMGMLTYGAQAIDLSLKADSDKSSSVIV
jgi:nicotinate-nucleotide pyrophosphorylase (carboxylating)